MKNEFAILILSCDKYSDLWAPQLKQFWKYWPDCPYKVYLGSNTKKFQSSENVEVLLSGPDKNWSTSFKKILEQIPEKYLFIWADDAFITEKVDTDLFQKCFNFLKKESTYLIEWRPYLGLTINKKAQFHKVEKGIPYVVSLIGFWQKKVLSQLLIEGESSWQFETAGSYRASFLNEAYCLTVPIMSHIHMVEKGKWLSQGVDYCKRNNIKIDLDCRPQLSSFINIKSRLQMLYFDTIIRFPWKMRVSIVNLIKKLLISY